MQSIKQASNSVCRRAMGILSAWAKTRRQDTSLTLSAGSHTSRYIIDPLKFEYSRHTSLTILYLVLTISIFEL